MDLFTLEVDFVTIKRARATNSKYGPVDLLKNENDWEGLKEWIFSKWIPADLMSVVMTSFSNWFLHYDVIKSVIITEIRLLCWNKQNWHVIFSIFTYAPTSDLIFVTTEVKSVLRWFFVYQKFLDRGVGQQKYWQW